MHREQNSDIVLNSGGQWSAQDGVELLITMVSFVSYDRLTDNRFLGRTNLCKTALLASSHARRKLGNRLAVAVSVAMIMAHTCMMCTCMPTITQDKKRRISPVKKNGK